MSGSGDKSEKPTAEKLRKAREKGEIPRSRDVSLAATLMMAFLCISLFAPFYRGLADEAFKAMRQMSDRVHDDSALYQFLLIQVLILLKLIATLLPIPLAGVVASLMPGGWLFVPSRLKPDIKKISPISGLKRMFSRQHLMDILKMIAKCVVLLSLLWIIIQGSLVSLLNLQMMPLSQAVSHGMEMFASDARPFVIVVVLFALIDVPLSKFLFTKKMKMTKKEVRDEYKNAEGDPHIKSRIRAIQRQLAMGQINTQVPHASVVITNPTHYAVALKYDPAKAPAPYVIAKGVDDVALYIRQIAVQNRIELVEFPLLTRAVYRSTQINQQIPSSLFRPMAQVLTYVMQLKAWRIGTGDKPQLNTQLHQTEEVIPAHGTI